MHAASPFTKGGTHMILVTGATGKLGHQAVKALLEKVARELDAA